MQWVRGELQEHWTRRHINADQHPVLQEVSNCIWQCIEEIEQLCGVVFANKYPPTVWWYDEPGFDVTMHTDGHLPSTMQLFWIAPSKEFATQFYEFKNLNSCISQLEFIPNSGYLMLNMLDENGSQPLQWHAMLNKVPKNMFRVTSYTTFGTYENK